jgi:hypothetical protein
MFEAIYKKDFPDEWLEILPMKGLAMMDILKGMPPKMALALMQSLVANYVFLVTEPNGRRIILESIIICCEESFRAWDHAQSPHPEDSPPLSPFDDI